MSQCTTASDRRADTERGSRFDGQHALLQQVEIQSKINAAASPANPAPTTLISRPNAPDRAVAVALAAAVEVPEAIREVVAFAATDWATRLLGQVMLAPVYVDERITSVH